MVYLLVFIFLLIASFIFDYGNIRSIQKNRLYFLFLIIFILVSGLRWKLGGDSHGYQDVFEVDIPLFWDFRFQNLMDYKWEPLFTLLMIVSKTISNDFVVFQIIHAIIVNVILFNFFKKYTKNLFTTLLIYGFFTFLYFNTEILRESIAIALFTLMYNSYNKKQWKKYYLIGIIAVGFHMSALIILIFPFFRNLNFEKNGLKAILGVFILFAILNILLPINSIIGLLGQSTAEKVEYYSSVRMNLNGMIFKAFFFLLCPYLAYRLKLYCSFKSTYNFDNLIFIYFLLACIYVAISGFGRFLNYMVPFMSVYYADLLILILTNKKIKSISFILVPVVLVIPFKYKFDYYLASTSHIYPNTTKSSLYYPYTNIFDKGNVGYREVLYEEGLREAYYNALERE